MHTSVFTFSQSVNLISPVLSKVFRLNIISSFFLAPPSFPPCAKDSSVPSHAAAETAFGT